MTPASMNRIPDTEPSLPEPCADTELVNTSTGNREHDGQQQFQAGPFQPVPPSHQGGKHRHGRDNDRCRDGINARLANDEAQGRQAEHT